jgi:hypothetical protein
VLQRAEVMFAEVEASQPFDGPLASGGRQALQLPAKRPVGKVGDPPQCAGRELPNRADGILSVDRE